MLHCTKKGILWQLVFSLFRVEWVMPDSVKVALLSWQGNFVGKRTKKAWVRVVLNDVTMSMVDLVDWLGVV